MTINLEAEYELELGLNKEELLNKVISDCLEYIECPYETEINVLFTDNDSIKAINNEYRDIDKATDVLSFPMIEYNNPGDFSVVEDDDMAFNPETGELLLGDIILCLDKVKEQAQEYGHTNEREMAFLVAHSMLHLFGYDHMEDDERVIMEEKQKEIMNLVGIYR